MDGNKYSGTDACQDRTIDPSPQIDCLEYSNIKDYVLLCTSDPETVLKFINNANNLRFIINKNEFKLSSFIEIDDEFNKDAFIDGPNIILKDNSDVNFCVNIASGPKVYISSYEGGYDILIVG